MRLGYAQVSTDEQTLTGQCQRLSTAGCEKLFEEKISGATRNRPKLEKLIEQLRKGDVLVVTRLDRLARTTYELLRIAERIAEKKAGLQSLDEPWAGPSGDLGDHDDRDRTGRVCCRLGIYGWNGRCVWLGWGLMVNPGVSRSWRSAGLMVLAPSPT